MADLDPLRLEMVVHRRIYLFAYSFFFSEMTEFSDRRFVEGCYCAEVNPDKFEHRLGVIEANFGLRVRQIEPVQRNEILSIRSRPIGRRPLWLGG